MYVRGLAHTANFKVRYVSNDRIASRSDGVI